MLFFVRRVVAVEEQELGAQQADTLRAGVDDFVGFGGLADVGDDFDAVAVAQDGGLEAVVPVEVALGSDFLDGGFGGSDVGFGRVDDQAAAGSVEDDGFTDRQRI